LRKCPSTPCRLALISVGHVTYAYSFSHWSLFSLLTLTYTPIIGFYRPSMHVNHWIIVFETAQMYSINLTIASTGRLIKFHSILFRPVNHPRHKTDSRVKSITKMCTNRKIIHKICMDSGNFVASFTLVTFEYNFFF
jgi:hypothetical protein